MKRNLLSILFIASLLTLAGCESTPPVEQTEAPVTDATAQAVKPAVPSVGTTKDPGVSGQPLGENAGGRDPRLTDPKNILSKRSVFFDFDSNAVKDEFKPLVTAHGTYLRDNRGRKVVIQGNTDERGSREYNIALGQRRADSVKQMMLLLGAQEAQLESVSFGKEKPRNPGHDEAAWAENRRADIVYDGE
ncbi:MAG: peptidoglycan-associated lipoprotein Pal [Burkholderiales bacterium]